MIRIARVLTGAASILVSMMAGSDAVAATIGYAPLSSIPTLSGSMLMVLGVLLAALAYRKLRAYPGGKPLASLAALGVMAAMSAVSGNQIIKSVEAGTGPGFTVYLTNPAGGAVTVTFIGITQVTNSTGAPLQITSITLDPGEAFTPQAQFTPTCAANSTVLQPGGSCYVYLNSGPT